MHASHAPKQLQPLTSPSGSAQALTLVLLHRASSSCCQLSLLDPAISRGITVCRMRWRGAVAANLSYSSVLGYFDLKDTGQLCKMEEPHRPYSARGIASVLTGYGSRDN